MCNCTEQMMIDDVCERIHTFHIILKNNLILSNNKYWLLELLIYLVGNENCRVQNTTGSYT